MHWLNLLGKNTGLSAWSRVKHGGTVLGEPYGDAPVLRKPFGQAELDGCLRMLIDRMLHPA